MMIIIEVVIEMFHANGKEIKNVYHRGRNAYRTGPGLKLFTEKVRWIFGE
jgi:hypothetical protein